MRHPTSLCIVATCLLLSACINDYSCYRDMVIGTWVEQTYDGQVPETRLRGIHVFSRPSTYNNVRSIQRMMVEDRLGFDISCKMISTFGSMQGVSYYLEEEILRFTDTTLRVKVVQEIVGGAIAVPVAKEIVYKKVSAANPNAKTIQNLWEVVQCSDPSVPPFQIKFDANGSYSFFLKDEQDQWVEKGDESGKYNVYDSFIATSFFNNPIFGVAETNDVACWDILFTQEEEKGEKGEEGKKKKVEMSWRAVVVENGARREKSFLFTSVVLP